jgi:hypothetical protein
MESYKNKYLKYKNKYLNLKKNFYQLGGSLLSNIKSGDIIKINLWSGWSVYKYMGKVSKDNSEKHYFEKQETDEGDDGPFKLYRDTLESLLSEVDDIRKEDNSIFDEFLPNIKTITELQHFKFNKYKYKNAILLPIQEINQGRFDESLSEKRKESLEKIVNDPNSLVPPIIIDKERNIVNGNHRYFISKKFGFSLIPIIYE